MRLWWLISPPTVPVTAVGWSGVVIRIRVWAVRFMGVLLG